MIEQLNDHRVCSLPEAHTIIPNSSPDQLPLYSYKKCILYYRNRCRDHSEDSFKRYVAAGILGRNLHVLGKILIAQEAALSQAAWSLRRPIAA